MATPSITISTNSHPNSNPSPESKPDKKRRKIFLFPDETSEELKFEPTRWTTQTQQHIYSTKLLAALRRSSSSPVASSVDSRSVRDTADRVLAVAAKGRTRWSRAILTRRLSLRLAQINRSHKKAKFSAGDILRPKKAPAEKKGQTMLQRKIRVLSRSVPGCRKISFPNLLEEATDYIAALEMQVRAMTTLAGLLTGHAASGGSLPTPNRLGSNQS